jgi:DNA repair exonuclease SbcCD ATPase subunit
MQAIAAGFLRGRIAHILHVGAGNGADLGFWHSLAPEKITLVEADPQCLPGLQQSADDKVEVLAGAVSADTQRSTLRRANLAELSSLKEPSGILSLFPGLQTLAQVPVPVHDPAELCGDLALSTEAQNVLVLEAPGEALGILSRLRDAGFLHFFSAILLQEGRQELYSRAGTLEEISTLLKSEHYGLTEIAGDDPDRPFLQASFDQEKKRLADSIEELRAMLQQADAENHALLTARQELEARLDSLQTEKKTALDEAARKLSQAEAARAKAEDEAKALRDAAEKSHAAVTELKANLKSAQDKAKADETARQELEARLDSLQTENKAAQDEAHRKLSHAEATRKKADEEIATLRRDLAAAKEDAQKQAESLTKAKQVASDEKTALQNKLSEANERHKQLQSDLNIVTDERDRLQKVERQLALGRESVQRAEGQIELMKDLLLRGPEL